MRPFLFPSTTPSWFLGHMAKSLRDLPALLKDIDLVIEARDARLPLTSVNGAFDVALERAWGGRPGPDSPLGGPSSSAGWMGRKGKGKEKVVVYTKRDLAEEQYEQPLKKAFLQHANQKVFFVDSTKDADVRALLRHTVDTAKRNREVMPEGMKILVVGMPNVGKSSLLNGLRRVGMHKAFRTGSTPGLTRKLTGTVKIHDDPAIYVFDTPGVMVPYLGKGEAGAERGLKLALTEDLKYELMLQAGIKEGLFPEDVVAEYLLWRMNKRLHDSSIPQIPWTSLLPLPEDFTPTESLAELLDALADRLGTLRKGGERDTDSARNWLIRAWREGRLGRWTLDDLEPDDMKLAQFQASLENPAGISSPYDARDTSLAPGLLPPPPPSLLDLDQKVSLAVRTFLATTAHQHTDDMDKRDLSLTQARKLQARKSDEERRQRLVARGIDVDARGRSADWRVRKGEEGRWRRSLRRTRAAKR